MVPGSRSPAAANRKWKTACKDSAKAIDTKLKAECTEIKTHFARALLRPTLVASYETGLVFIPNFNYMKIRLLSIGLLSSLVLFTHGVFAQTDEKFKIEEVKQKCAALPLEKRARVSVTRFTVTTVQPGSQPQENASANNRLKALGTIFNGGNAPQADLIPPILGDNLTTMLTNALHEVNCYRVLESLNNNSDLTGEINAGSNGYSNNKTPKAGKQLGAQIVVTGEVIEYSEKQKGITVVGVGSKKKYVKLGFNLKMINPETRDIIASHVFRVESRASKTVSVLGLVSTGNSDPAVAAVMEDGVVEAVQYMSRIRDSLNITSDGAFAGNGNANGEKTTEIILNNASFATYGAFASIVSGAKGYVSMQKSFSGGVGTYSVNHTGSTDQLLEEISKTLGTKYEITGEAPGRIELKVKQ
jgi:curli biogenesis system outer membrane secretion channel CsgG